MSETIHQPCEECGVDTVKLLSERDQLRDELEKCYTELEKCQADCAASRPSPRIIDLAQSLIAAGPKASHVSCSETHEISEFIFNLSTTSGQSILDQLHKLEVALKSALNVLEILKVSGMSRTWVIIEERDKLIDSTIATIKSCIGGEQ